MSDFAMDIKKIYFLKPDTEVSAPKKSGTTVKKKTQ